MAELSRRAFLETSAAAAVVGSMSPMVWAQPTEVKASMTGPVVISSENGLRATVKAAAMLHKGADTLVAAVAGVTMIEEDPSDNSVGYGGLPNEDGVVELDACVMHGPTCGAGAVAALRNVKTPAQVAKLVMERTDHCLLVGEGALRFAKAHGFPEVNLLTDESRAAWLEWKERHSDTDDWLPPPSIQEGKPQSRRDSDIPFTYGTVTCLARSAEGAISGVTSTSGLSYKIPGRVGDSPIIGAGLYVDNNVGAAGSTGRGEAVIKICGAHTVVEAMRHGMSPTDACVSALRRVVETTTEPRLKLKDGRPNFDLKFYALAKDGRFGAASMWEGAKFSVFADEKSRHEPCAFLFKRPEASD